MIHKRSAPTASDQINICVSVTASIKFKTQPKLKKDDKLTLKIHHGENAAEIVIKGDKLKDSVEVTAADRHIDKSVTSLDLLLQSSQGGQSSLNIEDVSVLY